MNATLKYILDKYNLHEVTTNPIEIPGVGRLDLLRWIRELDFKIGAEIGVASGDFSKLICLTNPQVKLYGVDPWKMYDGYFEYKSEAAYDENYKDMLKKMNPYIRHKKYVIIRKSSLEALKEIADGSLDFVYIDANHEAPYVQQDLEGWSKKVRSGGIIAGHDYIRVKVFDFAIKDALLDYSKKNNINWFVLGNYEQKPGVVRDRVRSWMLIQP